MTQSKQPAQHTCISCRKAEGGAVAGAPYLPNGDNGLIVRFRMCDDWAMKDGPSQGPIDMDDPTKPPERR